MASVRTKPVDYKEKYRRERARLVCTESVLYKALDSMSKKQLKDTIL